MFLLLIHILIYHILKPPSLPWKKSPKFPPNTSHFSLFFGLSFEGSFQIHSDPFYSEFEGDMQDNMKVMAALNTISQPLDAQNTLQPPSFLVGKSHNFIVSDTVPLVYVYFKYFTAFIGWKHVTQPHGTIFPHDWNLSHKLWFKCQFSIPSKFAQLLV